MVTDSRDRPILPDPPDPEPSRPEVAEAPAGEAPPSPGMPPTGSEARPRTGSGELPERAERTGTPSRPSLRWLARVAAALFGLLALFLLHQILTWPDVEALTRENPDTTAFVERWEDETGREARSTRVPYARISPHLKRAVLVSEDIDFFSHSGFDSDQIRDAVETAWERKELPRGASTLTQQLAKNLWLSSSRSPLRKAKEAILTVQLERHLSKHRIFELYLNVVELGPGIFGAEAAARHWFGRSAADLSEHQAAQLAAALPNPAAWHPGATSRRYRGRVETILRRMRKARFLWNEI